MLREKTMYINKILNFFKFNLIKLIYTFNRIIKNYKIIESDFVIQYKFLKFLKKKNIPRIIPKDKKIIMKNKNYISILLYNCFLCFTFFLFIFV